MNRISFIKSQHDEELEIQCLKNGISFKSMQRLLDAEKTKKLLKRNALIQQNIDREIDNSIENENR